MNKIILLGRLTQDSQLGSYGSDGKYTNNSIAVNSFSNGKETTTFVPIAAFGKTAELICKYFNKGNRILAEGRLINNNYKDKNGVTHYSMKVVVDRVYFVESKNSNPVNYDSYTPTTPTSAPAPIPTSNLDSLESFFPLDDSDGVFF